MCIISKLVASMIKLLAKKKNMPVKDVLQECGMERNSISHMTNGSMPKGDTLGKIADFFDCSVDYLLGRTDNPNFAENNKEITEQEYKVLSAYRQNPNMQQAVNKLLGVGETNSNIND